MKNLKPFLYLTFLLIVVVTAETLARPGNVPPRKIVVFQEKFVNEAAQSSLLKNFGAVKIKPLGLINGMAVYLPSQAEKALC